MNLSERLAAYDARLPEALRAVLRAEQAAGNSLIEVEVGRIGDPFEVAWILERPFFGDVSALPDGLSYREEAMKDRTIFEVVSAGGKFLLAYVKFKPMVLQPLGPGPPNPTEGAIARAQAAARREEEIAAARKAAANAPPAAPHDDRLGEAGNKFLASMVMTFDMWHDGTGYDLAALDRMPASERACIESILIAHHPRDWRDIEALARIDSPDARAEVLAALKSPDQHVRNEAMRHAATPEVDLAERESLLAQNLRNLRLMGGLSAAIDEAAEFHPSGVVAALFEGALHREGDIAVHFAALLFYIHGKAKEPFDWDQRPFFLRFNTSNHAEREAVFRELCATIGVDSEKYFRAR